MNNPKFGYNPTWWAKNPWLQLGLFTVKSKLLARLTPMHREELPANMSGDGELSIDWMDDTATRALPEDAPILCVLPTVTGSGPECAHFMRGVAATYGWRCCALNRRGLAGMPLASARFNVLGDAEDTRRQVAAVQRRFPRASFLGMAGLSAGSGLLINYLGKEGQASPVRVAASLCPAYDIETAFVGLTRRFPAIDGYIAASMRKAWTEPAGSAALLRAANPAAFEATVAAGTMHGFLTAHAPFAGDGIRDFGDYCEAHNPMKAFRGIACPTLVLNALDDPVCLAENIPHDLIHTTPNFCLVLTQHGSHIAFCAGAAAQRQWMTEVTMEFFEAARKEALEQGQDSRPE